MEYYEAKSKRDFEKQKMSGAPRIIEPETCNERREEEPLENVLYLKNENSLVPLKCKIRIPLSLEPQIKPGGLLLRVGV